MAKKLKEQINYGDRPERMDPNLERKLGDPESLYAKNPSMKKGVSDVQRLVSSRFGKVADKLKQVTGNQNIGSRQVQQMIYQEMMSRLPNIMRIEGRHRDELEQLAVEASLEELQVPEDWFTIEPYLNRAPIDTSNFRYEPDEDDEEEEDDEKPKLSIPSFDVEDLTDEEILELEKHKRNIINAIIQMIEMMSQTGQGVAGKVELSDSGPDDEEEGGEEFEEKPDTVIKAFGMMFPILCHEIIKGVEEAKGRYGLPQDQGMRQKVQGQVDLLSNEPMQLRIGPEIVEKIRFALPDAMFDDENKGLINWFHIQLYQIPAEEFLEIIGNAISEDQSKVKKATQRFDEIMKEAQELKREYDDYKEENGTDSEDEDDEDDLDDFLGGLGISMPK